MNRLKTAFICTALLFLAASCASYSAYQRAHAAEKMKNWDEAVVQYEKALAIDPNNLRYKVDLQRAKLEASREHFQKGKTLSAAAMTESGPSQLRLAQLAATELELTIKLDRTNDFAAVEYGKIIQLLRDITTTADKNSIDEMKKRSNLTKAQPPQLNPASNQPISLSFARETPVKDIYRALGNAFGINILFDQAVKNDPISIELKDVTAQQALERVMQAAGNFYKVLDEHTIIVAPDNPQARRDYEDLVIRTFYLSNGDAEQVTNVVRTMLEARNVFPLKALNAITIRDTADKVRIAEKIIQANDKAKAEVVVDVELLQLDASREQDIGAYLAGTSGSLVPVPTSTSTTGTTGTTGTTATASTDTSPAGTTLKSIRTLKAGNFTFVLPTVAYSFVKTVGEAQTLANPELRISEGEKATLHIGSRVPVPIASFQSIGVGTTAGGAFSPTVSYQYQDIGIKVAIEPRVHHNREVTLKLTVEVSDLGQDKNVAGQLLPTFITRTIEDTIRLKDGETNFLAGLIQRQDQNADNKTPFLGDIPFFGRFFTQNLHKQASTDLMLTMTPHIVRIADITDDDLAPMWVGTQNNITFRGVSPRIESRAAGDPFVQQTINGRDAATGLPLAPDGEPGNIMQPPPPFTGRRKPAPAPAPNPPGPDGLLQQPPSTTTEPPVAIASASTTLPSFSTADSSVSPAIAPRIAPQPSKMSFKPGEEKQWTVVGMDLDGMTTNEIVMHYDPRALDVADVSIGPAMKIDPQKPPIVRIDAATGTIRIMSSDAQPLAFNAGGDIAAIRLRGGTTGDSYLVLENPSLKNGRGDGVAASVSGGHAVVQ